MNSQPAICLFVALLLAAGLVSAQITPEQIQSLPPPASHKVDFAKEIKPIIEASCINCHGRGKDKGGFTLDTRETTLDSGDSGPAVLVGNSAQSHLIHLVAGLDPDNIMPQKGTKLTPEQIGVLRAWIDQGIAWENEISFAKKEPINLDPRRPEVPPAIRKFTHPIDRILEPYFAAHKIKPAAPVDDRTFARRVYLDVIGLLPTPEEINAFLRDRRTDKRERLVKKLLADNKNYADHWLTFWNDMLRNDYAGTGYIDGGRKQITAWLYTAQYDNMPFDQFVAQLVDPKPESEGFAKGIIWRGVVNASQTPAMQAAQNISQVFMGVNLKCASCHDSFIDDWRLSDAYGLANIYSDEAIEMVECDKPTGKMAPMRFIYPQLGDLNAAATKPERLKQLSVLLTQRENGRLSRTIVNRLWERLMGRGLVEPLDDMETPAWNSDLLDWLAEDLVEHGYDLKHTIARIATSRAYQMPAAASSEQVGKDYVFHGPLVRRMSAEQFRDAIAMLTGIWYDQPAVQIPLNKNSSDNTTNAAAKWIWKDAEAATATAPGTIYFRKTIHLPELPTEALAAVTADNRFTLFINGRKVSSGDNWNEPKLSDIRSHLVKGENLIAISAINDGDKPNPAGLLFHAHVRNTRGTKPVIMDFASDGSWTWWEKKPPANWHKSEFKAENWAAAAELGAVNIAPWTLDEKFSGALAATGELGKVRASRVRADALQVALGRPNREQVITSRASAATTLEALELTNGAILTDLLHRGAARIVEARSDRDLVQRLYTQALGRKPSRHELRAAQELVGKSVQQEGVEDLLWALAMLPEFQLIY